MKFVETPIFTKRVNVLLSDDEYRSLQAALLFRPEQGSLIRGGRGLRKMRWRTKRTGKRGGLRLIYYWDESQEIIYMLLLYSKPAKDDLTPAQLKQLSNLIQEEVE